jgi:hypothetical protein
MLRLALLSLLACSVACLFGFSGYGLVFEAGRVLSFGFLALALFLLIGNYLRGVPDDPV